MNRAAAVALGLAILAACGASDLGSEQARAMIAEGFPGAEVVVDGVRSDDDSFVARATIDGLEGTFQFELYDTGWKLESALEGIVPLSVSDWRERWLAQLIEPEEIDLAEYLAGARPEWSLRVKIPFLVVTDVRMRRITMVPAFGLDGAGPEVVIVSENIDLFGIEVGDVVDLTTGSLHEREFGLHPEEVELPEGLRELLGDELADYTESWMTVTVGRDEIRIPYVDGEEAARDLNRPIGRQR